METKQDIMYQSLMRYASQFLFDPEIVNRNKFKVCKSYIVCGMGGSNQASELIKRVDPSIDIILHRSYDLPILNMRQWEDRLVIINSHSGNTEETISSLDLAHEKNIPHVIIATGGTLLERAQKENIPYIQMPHDNFEPRMATAFQFRALASIMGRQDILDESKKLAYALKPELYEYKGKNLARKINGYIPLIYASDINRIYAYMWKISLNESGKVLAFHNVVPEMNHNEMEGFNPAGATKDLFSKLYMLFIRDPNDHPRIKKRMDIFSSMMSDVGGNVDFVSVEGETIYEQMFSLLITVGWTAYYLAMNNGVDPQIIPSVKKFKKMILE